MYQVSLEQLNAERAKHGLPAFSQEQFDKMNDRAAKRSAKGRAARLAKNEAEMKQDMIDNRNALYATYGQGRDRKRYP